MKTRWLFLAVSCSTLLGCPSVTTMGSARTMQQGKFQGFFAPEVAGVSTNVSGTTATAIVPQLELGGRYGITDRVELGAKLWLLGAELNGKFGILRPDSPDNGLNLSVNPGVSYLTLSGSSTGGGTASATNINIYLPVLIGYRVSGHEFILGPKLLDTVVLASGGGSTSAANLLSVGGSIGVAFKLSDTFRILPEFSYMYPVLGSSGSGSSSTGGLGFFQAGIGFLFGGGEDRPRAEPEAPPAPSPSPASTVPTPGV